MISLVSGYSEVIHADEAKIIQCTSDSIPSGCHVKCLDSYDCFHTDIYCFPGVPCFVECMARSDDEVKMCGDMKVYGGESSILNVYIEGSWAGAYADVFGTKNGSTYINLIENRDKNYLNIKGNIYGQPGQLIVYSLSSESRTRSIENTVLHCPANQNGVRLCKFNCDGLSDCRGLNIITENGLSDVDIHCADSIGCANVEVYTRSTYCQMQWKGDEWKCVDRYLFTYICIQCIFMKLNRAIYSLYSEVILAKRESTIECTEDSIPDGCHVICEEESDCERTAITCYPGTPCRIDCIPRSASDSLTCFLINILGESSSLLDVFFENGYRSGEFATIHGSENGQTNVSVTGIGTRWLSGANIYGQLGKFLFVRIYRASGVNILSDANIHCPANLNGERLCEFNCFLSNCTNANIYTKNGIPMDLEMICDDKSDCTNLEVFCDFGRCEMKWNKNRWLCNGGRNRCILPTPSPYVSIHLSPPPLYIYF